MITFLLLKNLLYGAETSGMVMASETLSFTETMKMLPQPSNPQIFRVLEINQRYTTTYGIIQGKTADALLEAWFTAF